MHRQRDPRTDPRAGDIVWFADGDARVWHCAVVARIAGRHVHFCRAPIGDRVAEDARIDAAEDVCVDVDAWRQRARGAHVRFPSEARRVRPMRR